MKVTYRVLPSEEWDRLADIFKEHDWYLPDPAMGFAVVGEDEQGEICRMWMVQTALLAEPFWQRSDIKEVAGFKEMYGMVREVVEQQSLFPGVLVHVADGDSTLADIAHRAGMQELKVKTYLKQFEKAAVKEA